MSCDTLKPCRLLPPVEDASARVLAAVREALDREFADGASLRGKLAEVQEVQRQLNDLRRLRAELPEPYCRIAEAAAWLRVSPDTINRNLVFGATREPNRIRAVRLGLVREIRCRTEDVYAMLPKP